ncbi:hypothetical protein N9R06_00500 [Algibacter sp.]|nr:hypothetical protein [Algibacter sp.]
MWDKKNKKYINDEITLESLLNEGELSSLEILDEDTGEVDEIIDTYDGYIRLIGYSVSLRHNILKLFNEQSKKLNTSLHNNNDKLKAKMKETLIRAHKCSKSISNHVMGLYDYCEKTNRYWHNCSLEVYKNYFPHFLKVYLEKFSNSNELNFLKCEYESFLLINMGKKPSNPSHLSAKETDDLIVIGYQRCLNTNEKEFFKIETQKKLDFISNRILELGYYVQFIKEKKKFLLNLIPVKNEKTDFDKLDEEVLNKSQLPSFSLLERYELVCRFEIDKAIHDSNALKKEKNKLLALLMDCSLDNARKLLDNTYKTKDKQKNEERKAAINEKIDEFLNRNEIEINPIK